MPWYIIIILLWYSMIHVMVLMVYMALMPWYRYRSWYSWYTPWSRAAEAVWLVWHLPYHFFVRMQRHTTLQACIQTTVTPPPGSPSNKLFGVPWTMTLYYMYVCVFCVMPIFFYCARFSYCTLSSAAQLYSGIVGLSCHTTFLNLLPPLMIHAMIQVMILIILAMIQVMILMIHTMIQVMILMIIMIPYLFE